MENMDAFFSPDPATATATATAPAASFGDHDENARTLDSETSMDITTSRSRVESPGASPRRAGLPSPGVLPRRTPVKTNIGSPARRSDIARKLDSASREERFQAVAKMDFMPESIRGKQRGLASKNWKPKPFAIADYDVLEDEEHASDSVSELEVGVPDAESVEEDEDDKNEKENQAPDEIDAKMRSYREFQEREKRESEERLRQITDQRAKKLQAISEVKKKSVLQVQNKNVSAADKVAVTKRTIPGPTLRRESESGSAVEDDDMDIEEVSELSEFEVEPDDEEFVKPQSKKVVKAQAAPLKKVSGKPKVAPKKVTSKPASTRSKPNGKAAPIPSTSASQPGAASGQSSEPPRKLSENIKRIIPEPPAGSCAEEDGVRRSKRVRVQPLAYWRNERIVYNLGERRESGPALPQIKEIIMVDSPQSMTTSRASTQRKSRGASVFRRTRIEDELSDVANESEPDEVVGEVNDFMDDEKIVKRRLAVSGHAIPFLQTASSTFKFAKTFDEPGGFMASGMVLLPVHGEKGSRPSRHNALAFCVVEGHVEVTIQDTMFRLRRGGHTIVPRGGCILFGQ
ncbi:Mif2/CENP-C like-domain-containing protein [Lipomyces chichibuensis]|uniref:Mif2/CENP-C like-domain-containing protein n=1 Tax=Lipomyces chichibuensis TaxID=1546026 RepID=UPI003343972C